MSQHPEMDLALPQPPEGFSNVLKALWWLKKGNLKTGAEWEQAHLLCQEGEGQLAFDLIHALAHQIEGDGGNADYWYSRAGEPRGRASISERWESLVVRFGGGEAQ